jgi:AhpD family alkylhydroperoxidase
MRKMKHSLIALMSAGAVVGLALFGKPAIADDAAVEATLAEIQATLGFTPTFVSALPKAALPGAWIEARDVLFTDSALDAKTKALIGLAVSAQIPCSYCIYDDTLNAKRAGASDEEIKEAVAVAALSRHWSTIFNGNQVDFETFKKEMGGM